MIFLTWRTDGVRVKSCTDQCKALSSPAEDDVRRFYVLLITVPFVHCRIRTGHERVWTEFLGPQPTAPILYDRTHCTSIGRPGRWGKWCGTRAESQRAIPPLQALTSGRAYAPRRLEETSTSELVTITWWRHILLETFGGCTFFCLFFWRRSCGCLD